MIGKDARVSQAMIVPHGGPAPDQVVAEIEQSAAAMAAVRARLGEVIHGQDQVIDQVLSTIVAGGHALLVGVPGLAKTLLVDSLGTVLGLGAKRIQCTPDLMPSDILGAEVLEIDSVGARSFRFIPGPVFTQILMADEINRASPRTQSSLLQAMQEQKVSVAGQDHDVPRPFHVLATQNPIEQEGTYPLPEAQLDRFLMRVDVGYPDRNAERQMLLSTTGATVATPMPVLDTAQLQQAQRLARALPVGDTVVEAVLDLVTAARPETSPLEMVQRDVLWGPGPRASQALLLASKARALLEGRLSPSVDDVIALAQPILIHRMALTYTAQSDGRAVTDVIATLTERLD